MARRTPPDGSGSPQRSRPEISWPGPGRSTPDRRTIHSLRERAKELDCLYEVEEILSSEGLTVEEALAGIIAAIPTGWQYPATCQARIVWQDKTFASPDYLETEWLLKAPLRRDHEQAGEIAVAYRAKMPSADSGPFLKEEVRLINVIAERLSHYLQQKEHEADSDEWRGATHLLHATDPALYLRVSRRMIRHLCLNGVEEAQEALQKAGERQESDALRSPEADNRPGLRTTPDDTYYMSDEPFELAAQHMSGSEIVRLVQVWMLEEKSTVLARIVNNRQSSLTEITKALRAFVVKTPNESSLPPAMHKGIAVSLIRRFLTDDLDLIGKMEPHIRIADFLELAEHMIYPADSKGRIGGKGAGLLLAKRVLESNRTLVRGDFPVKVPLSWYVVSDSFFHFMEYNDLHDWVLEQKYKDIDQVRQEYPVVVQMFKNARFSPEMVKGLSLALDDLSGRPLIVRSSSLGEDRQGTAFSGKYKSLFLANQGTKRARLEALLDAVAEVYASIFSPDPIQYRRERGLLDFDEEMGILLQGVVGARSGKYYFPAFSGVALSTNEFAWSPRIERHDGLIRLVPGLGTRAVDRVGDDYPVLVSPGKPGLRANTSLDEKVKYAPRMIDLIDLEAASFKSLKLATVLKEPRVAYPAFGSVFSALDNERLSRPSPLTADPERQELVVTFEGLLSQTTFVKQMNAIIGLLQDALSAPVDIEFACDGKDLYILQCRAQSYSADAAPAPIPHGLPEADVLFRARRHVSNGAVPDITHVVYVVPQAYDELETMSDLKAVGTAVGRLNAKLPTRRFILLGPGRWGSRGDIKLGVNVTYSDISNTAVLVEVARK
ncbi:MAG: PEP/pyruvate-binding domain-containing protein, partial [Thermoleophilia bacterium]|nr:PEP/pyruvate-binding domain-containing protein [Thermoleophilia bacterium]